jgi:3-hydroxyisobutyrate dehydrogenase
MSSMMQKIAFIGIGNMGWPMATCLVRQGYHVKVFDAIPGRAADFVRDVGGVAAHTPTDVAAGVDVVITMLPTSGHVEQALIATADSIGSGSLVIEMSSGLPSVTRTIAEGLAARGVAMIDAPVSGGVERARSGTLAILAGGDPDVLERARPVLDTMGSSIHRIGDVGAGQAMKALNNLVSAGGFLIGIEALVIGKSFGLNPEMMVDALNSSTGMNNSTKNKFKQFVLSGKFDSGFGLDLMVKDLAIALDVGAAGGTATPFSALCLELARATAGLLGPGRDHTEFARLPERLSGVHLHAEPNDA